MSADNKYFEQIERAPYELGWLLKKMPTYFPYDRPMSEDEQLMAQAARDHASHGTDTLLTGMEAIGHLLFTAGTNPDFPIKPQQAADMGRLITHIAVEAQFLKERIEEIDDALKVSKELTTAAPTRKPTAKNGGAV